MKKYPDQIKTVNQLMDILSTPTPELVDFFRRLKGDLMVLGVAGKIGPSLARMAKRAAEQAGVDKRIIGVSRFNSDGLRNSLEKNGIETVRGDMLDAQFLKNLPTVENVIFMAGKKFGSAENIPLMWATNTYLSGLVAERFKASKIAVYSTGCIYSFSPVKTGGATEETPPHGRGEYAQSCLGRERLFEYTSLKYKTPVVVLRLNYAVEMRYGVLLDIALKVKNNIPIDLTMGVANTIWQGDANALALRSLELCDSPAKKINLTGPETLSIRWVANRFGGLFKIDPVFENQESDTAWFTNSALCQRLFGYPTVPLDQVILWTSKWIENNMPTLNKPTHFENRSGKF